MVSGQAGEFEVCEEFLEVEVSDLVSLQAGLVSESGSQKAFPTAALLQLEKVILDRVLAHAQRTAYIALLPALRP